MPSFPFCPGTCHSHHRIPYLLISHPYPGEGQYLGRPKAGGVIPGEGMLFRVQRAGGGRRKNGRGAAGWTRLKVSGAPPHPDHQSLCEGLPGPPRAAVCAHQYPLPCPLPNWFGCVPSHSQKAPPDKADIPAYKVLRMLDIITRETLRRDVLSIYPERGLISNAVS